MTYELNPKRRRAGTWTIVAISSFALIATSAPDVAMVGSTASVTDTQDSVQAVVTINEDGICEASGAGLEVSISAEATAEEIENGTTDVVATITFGSADIPSQEVALFLTTLSDDTAILSGSVTSNLFDGCAVEIEDDEACSLTLNVDLSAVRTHSVGFHATLVNSVSGCPISNPSLSDDADIDITFPPPGS